MSDILQLFTSAVEAENQAEFEQAKKLYQIILEQQPGNAKATESLKKIDVLLKKNIEVLELIKEADELYKQPDYAQAARCYSQAMSHAAAAGITCHHTLLEVKYRQAKQMDYWGNATEVKQAEAQKLSREKNWGQAYALLTDFLENELPLDDQYQIFAIAITADQQKARGQMSSQTLFDQAAEALTNEDYEEAIRLAEAIPSNANNYADAQYLLRSATTSNRYLKSFLEDAEQACQEQRWDDAFGRLEDMKRKFPKSPAWGRMWLRVAGTYGQVELEIGKEVAQQRDFKMASKHFDNAKTAFGKIHIAYENHRAALAGEMEAAELSQLAQYAGQAQLDLEHGRREDALNALGLAKTYLAQARENEREYPVLEVLLTSLYKRVEQELENIRQVEIELSRGRELLAKRELSQAREIFTRARVALLPEQQEQAQTGLKQVEQEIHRFEQAMTQGRQTSDSLKAVKFYYQAFECWPTGPDILTLYENALFQAAQQALGLGNTKLATELLQQLLARLNPDSIRAKELLERIGLAPQVEILVNSARDRLEAAETTMQNLEVTLAELTDMREKAEKHAGLKTQVDELWQAVNERLETWRQGEAAIGKAETALKSGNWPEALQSFEAALQALAERAPRGLSERFKKLKVASSVLEQTRAELPGALDRAQTAYEICLQPNNLNPAEHALAEAEILLGRADQVLDVAQAPTPRWLIVLKDRATGLRQRLQAIQAALANPQVREALAQVRGQLKLFGQDSVLESLEDRLAERLRDDLPRLLAQAEDEAKAGRVKQAQEVLRLASEIDPANREIQKNLNKVNAQARLLDEIQRVYQNYASEQNSSPQAAKTLKGGLEALRDAPSDLVGAELSGVLDELLRLASNEEGLALGKDQYYSEAQRLVTEIGKNRNVSWVALEASRLVDEWLSLARLIALDGVVASEIRFEHQLEAYRAACKILQSNPHDERLIKQEAAIREALINKQAASAKKRLLWAQEAFAQDDFADALTKLNSIETEYFAPVDQEFPNLLEYLEEIEEIRKAMRELLPQIQRRKSLYEKVQPVLDEALVLYQKNNLDTADGKLDELLGIDWSDSSKLEQKVQDLRQTVAKARHDTAQRHVREGLAGVEAGLRLARTVEDFKCLHAQLDSLNTLVNLKTQSVDIQAEYNKVRVLVDDEANKLNTGDIYKSRGQEAFNNQDFIEAASCFAKALQLIRIPVDRVELEGLLEKAEAQVGKQRELQTILELGQSSLEQGEYAQARLAFYKAEGLGAEVKLPLALASAGTLHKEAEEARKLDRLEEAQEALEDAQLHLNEIIETGTAQDTFASRRLTLANELFKDVQKHLGKVKKLLNSDEDRRKKLAEARQAYLDGKLTQAEALTQELLDKKVDDIEALAIQAVCMARKLYNANQDDEAQGILEQLSERVADNSLVIALKGQIKARYEVNRLLVQAENQARNGEFQGARTTLLEAAKLNPDANRYEEAQRKVDEFRSEWEHKTILPIQAALRPGKEGGSNYAEAVRLCELALKQATASEFQTDLNSLLADAIRQWAGRDYKEFSQRLIEFNGEDELNGLKSRIELTLARRVDLLEEKVASQFELLEQEIDQKIQRLRLAHAEIVYKDLSQRFGQLQTEAELLILMNEIDVAQTREPVLVEFLGKKFEALKQDIGEKVLQIRIDETRKLKEDGKWQQAILRLKTIRQDVEAWSAWRLISEVDLLILQFKQAQHDGILDQLSQNFRDALNRKDLNHILDAILNAQGELDLAQDVEFKHLEEELRDALKVFDKNDEAKNKVRDFVRHGRFSAAELELRSLLDVSPLQTIAVEELRTLVDLLISGEKKQGEQLWEGALKDYQQALTFDPSLKSTLAANIEICKENLVKDMLSSAENCLHSQPVQFEQASRLLEKAKDWLTPKTENVYNQLYDWLVSQEKVAQAIQILSDPEKDYQEAQTLLDLAERTWPADRSKKNLMPWKNLALAIGLWQKMEFSQADSILRNLPDELTKLPYVQNLLGAVQDAQEIDHGLKSNNFEAAAASAYRLKTTSKDKTAEMWVNKVAQALKNRFDSAEKTGSYGEAERIGRAQMVLSPDDEALYKLYIELTQNYDKRYQDLLAKIDDDLSNWQLNDAELKMSEAKKFVKAPDDVAFNRLQLRYDDLKPKEKQVRDSLEQYKTAYAAGNSSEALLAVNEARKKAPGHPLVNQAVVALRTSLFEQIETALGIKNFPVADNLLQQASQLREDDETLVMRRRILETRETYLLEHRKFARRALDAWNLEQADWAIQIIVEQSPDDIVLPELEKKKNVIQQKSMYTFEALKIAWDNLRNADVKTAFDNFDRAASYAQDLEEIQIWLQYTRNLRDSIQAIKNEQFHHAAELLNTAEQLLLLDPNQLLPSVFLNENYVRERRRIAAYNAARLCAYTQDIEKLHSTYLLHEQNGNDEAEIQCLQKLVDQIKQFNQSLRMMEVPENYSIERIGQIRSQSENQTWSKDQKQSLPSEKVQQTGDENDDKAEQGKVLIDSGIFPSILGSQESDEPQQGSALFGPSIPPVNFEKKSAAEFDVQSQLLPDSQKLEAPFSVNQGPDGESNFSADLPTSSAPLANEVQEFPSTANAVQPETESLATKALQQTSSYEKNDRDISENLPQSSEQDHQPAETFAEDNHTSSVSEQDDASSEPFVWGSYTPPTYDENGEESKK